MKKRSVLLVAFSIIVSMIITFNSACLEVAASATACGNDHASSYQIRVIERTLDKHTIRSFCPVCNKLLDGTNGTYDTLLEQSHTLTSRTYTPSNATSHNINSICEVCGSFIISEEHTFNSKGVCTKCNYDKNNPDGGSTSGSGGEGNSSGENGGGSGGTGTGEGGGNGGSGGGGGAGAMTGEKIAQIPEGQTLVYNGKKQTGVAEGTGYTVTGNKQKNAGTYKATAKLAKGYKWSDGTTKAKTIKWKINKAKNPGVLKFRKNPTVKYKKLKKTKQTIKSSKLFKLSKAVGKVSYSMEKANVKIGVNRKTGNLVIKPGLPKGTYNVTVKVSAAGDKNYKKGTATVTLKLTVK
ncbi:hypothetical protein [Butyrivibrio sp. AE3006]|uniref:hypothetical protein n=1 Tax=Butyrivibrio sp. AE3006 TaxID=1280673 RepID=UPI0012DCAC2E|nr:hypothetical protein [Butyrivibrio sp. AE3006]